MLMTATQATISAHHIAPSGSITIPIRMMPKAPSFMRTPAWSIETAVGAEACPSGDQVWKGKTPASVPNPIQSAGNAHHCIDDEYRTCSSSSMEKVVAPFSTYMARIPARMKADPRRSISVSFIAAYSFPPMSSTRKRYLKGPASATFLVLPQTPISRYIGSTAIS